MSELMLGRVALVFNFQLCGDFGPITISIFGQVIVTYKHHALILREIINPDILLIWLIV